MRGFRIVFGIIFFSLLFLFTAGSVMPKDKVDQEIEEVRKMIDQKGYHWTAGRTSVSELSLEERQKLLGLRVPEGYDEWLKNAGKLEAPAKVSFPLVFDWRDSAGVTPVKDQGGCGSCWAFCAMGALEAMAKIYGGLELDLSEQQILSCISYGWGCNGGWMEDAYDLFLDYGSVSEACMPYRTIDTQPCIQESCEVLAKITGWTPVAYNVDAIKTALLSGPVACAMTVYYDFFHYNEGCYEHAGFDPCNHGVLIVGWDDTLCGGEGVWIVKNSWGPGWGMDGFFYIKYFSCNIGYATDLVHYVVPGPYVNLESFSVDDSTEGNGNGRPEPEETVNIYLSFSNLWVALNQASVTASADTDGIVFINGRSDLGDILVNDTVDNYSNPIQFFVPQAFPPKKVNFTFRISGNGGTYNKSWTKEIWIGRSSILLVDDDQDSNVENYYIETLNLLGPLYDRWDKASQPDAVYDFSDYDVVIWFTGDHRDSIFSDQDIQSLITYLDNSGRLFLTSQDVAEALSGSSDPLDTFFLHNYLHTGYSGDYSMHLVSGYPGDEVGDTLRLYPGGVPGAENQESKDILAPDAQVDTVLLYAGSFFAHTDSVAGIKYQGDYKLVFIGFGFEAINSSGFYFNGQWLSKPQLVMQRVLEWLKTPWLYMPGDASGDRVVDIGDVVVLTNYLFKNGASPNPLASGDADDNCVVEVGDVMYLINYLFKGGPPPKDGCAR